MACIFTVSVKIVARLYHSRDRLFTAACCLLQPNTCVCLNSSYADEMKRTSSKNICHYTAMESCCFTPWPMTDVSGQSFSSTEGFHLFGFITFGTGSFSFLCYGCAVLYAENWNCSNISFCTQQSLFVRIKDNFAT